MLALRGIFLYLTYRVNSVSLRPLYQISVSTKYTYLLNDTSVFSPRQIEAASLWIFILLFSQQTEITSSGGTPRHSSRNECINTLYLQ